MVDAFWVRREGVFRCQWQRRRLEHCLCFCVSQSIRARPACVEQAWDKNGQRAPVDRGNARKKSARGGVVVQGAPRSGVWREGLARVHYMSRRRAESVDRRDPQCVAMGDGERKERQSRVSDASQYKDSSTAPAVANVLVVADGRKIIWLLNRELDEAAVADLTHLPSPILDDPSKGPLANPIKSLFATGQVQAARAMVEKGFGLRRGGWPHGALNLKATTLDRKRGTARPNGALCFFPSSPHRSQISNLEEGYFCRPPGIIDVAPNASKVAVSAGALTCRQDSSDLRVEAGFADLERKMDVVYTDTLASGLLPPQVSKPAQIGEEGCDPREGNK
ncbi:hypothetical protein BU24DRAFT_453296 [Aaosphaeria arxii CBS 175.79]|uniref:Uncharacterized protein n=1 Tax=Aaosphaeria arxii CBS 175.79 TaxID=1450172 RepID=A0A6A5XJK6_9PLEO|nr:uncharacterized protein BU24DRAFT_453296 [Aaosphaeria arxii CBS 175.79]KAF2013021.1 hypothetical protein BU24DRAFT_453296 [Aaosphaeria arxii CBS 175.79]